MALGGVVDPPDELGKQEMSSPVNVRSDDVDGIAVAG